MARTWLSIRVELIEGGGRSLWPRPGRVFAAARSHTFAALADAIDTAFARWDRAHLCLFELADKTDVCGPIRWEDPPEGSVFAGDVRLSRLTAGEQLLYTFDMGDDWTHLCTVGEQRIDPIETLGIIPAGPPARSRTGAGARSPTNTAAAPKTTTAKHHSDPTRSSPTCRRCAHSGARKGDSRARRESRRRAANRISHRELP